MTELELIERAQMYIQKLANGINPLTDEAVSENDTVNQVRISRCLFYVSDILKQVIKNGGVTSPAKTPKAKKVPFNLPYEKRSAFRTGEKPIPITELTKRINALCEDENMKALSYKDIRNWLVVIEMLRVVSLAEGKHKYTPTESGFNLGITEEERESERGRYVVVLYNRDAQQFIMDNLDAILDLIETE